MRVAGERSRERAGGEEELCVWVVSLVTNVCAIRVNCSPAARRPYVFPSRPIFAPSLPPSPSSSCPLRVTTASSGWRVLSQSSGAHVSTSAIAKRTERSANVTGGGGSTVAGSPSALRAA
eukprot:2942608-Prymnesium_polylepis.1